MDIKNTIFLCIGLCVWQSSFAQNRYHVPDKKEIPGNKSKTQPRDAKLVYQPQLQTWCDGMLAQQVNGGNDDGGIFCEAHQFVHGRCGDAVYPMLALFHLTRNEKYRAAALKLFNWSESHVSQPDGSWTNETGGRNDWKGISCFSTISIGEALRHHGNLLPTEERRRWLERLRKGGDFVLTYISFETGDINYPMSAAAALAICWKLLGDEKYLRRARELAAFGLTHFTANKLLWGEGIRGLSDTTSKGLRPIDIPYNLEESLPNLALYATLTGDKKVLDIVTASMQAHLEWMLPDGGLDAGWCSRQYKWTYFGSTTADGCAGGLSLMGNSDQLFGEAALRNLKLRQSYTHNGILYGGAHLYGRNIPACNHHTFASAKGLAAAIDAGISHPKNIAMPSDKAFGVHEWPEASVFQVALGPWRASVTTNDIASSPKRGGYPLGGALSMLWHEQTGPVAVASMNDYKLYEGSNMQKASNNPDQFCLTPRIEAVTAGERYANVYDTKAKLAWSKNGDSVRMTVHGDLRNVSGNLLPGEDAAFTIEYIFTKEYFQMSVNTKAAAAMLMFPVVSQASELVEHKANGELIVKKGDVRLKLISNKTTEWMGINDKRVFNFVPGFEALPVKNSMDANGTCIIRLEIGNDGLKMNRKL